jgi:predicted kinase
VERKRLFGLPPLARTEVGVGTGIYAPDATERTYARLLALTQQCLDAGYGALVDATFLSAQRRRPFHELAEALGCPFDILALDAPTAVLRRRVLGRRAAGTDASEADLAVLDQQLADREPLTGTERARAIFVDSSGVGALEGLVRLLSV